MNDYLGHIITVGVSMVAVAFGYGSINAQVKENKSDIAELRSALSALTELMRQMQVENQSNLGRDRAYEDFVHNTTYDRDRKYMHEQIDRALKIEENILQHLGGINKSISKIESEFRESVVKMQEAVNIALEIKGDKK